MMAVVVPNSRFTVSMASRTTSRRSFQFRSFGAEQLDDDYQPDDLGIRLVGIRTSKIFTMSDPVRVRIEDVNVQARDIVGSLLDHRQAEAPTEAERRQRRPAKKRSESRRGGTAGKRREPRKRPKRARRR